MRLEWLDLLNIKSAKNDGVLGSLRTILKNPGNVIPQLSSALGPVCRAPGDSQVFDDRAKCRACVCLYCHVSILHIHSYI